VERTTSSLNVDLELHAKARAAVRIVSRATGRRYTLAQFMREAIVGQLAIVARDYCDGRSIQPDADPLAPGR